MNIVGPGSASGADLSCGCVVPLTFFSFPFQKNVDHRRFRGLARALDSTQPEIERESEQLRRARKRMIDCAAFSLEATDNGEKTERMSAKLDILAQDIAANRARHLLLNQQMSFPVRTRAGLPRLLRSHRA